MGEGKGDIKQRRPEQIRREIEDTRRRIDAALGELESRFQAEGLVNKAEAILGDELRRNRLIQTVHDNPVPSVISAMALAGAAAGIAYLAAEGPDGRHEEDYAEREGPGVMDQAREKAGEMGESISDAAGRAGDAIRSGADKLRSSARHARGHAGERIQQAGQSIKQKYDEHPLAAGAAALAAGVLLGELLPSTRTEDQIMGQASDKVTDKARETAQKMAGKAKETAKSAVEAGAEEADRQGISPSQLGEKAKAVGSAAADAAKQKADEEGITPEQMKESAKPK